jgi:hypothetical protein
LGYMTPNGWEDFSDRATLEATFYNTVRGILVFQGINETEQLIPAIEMSRTLGLLLYYIPKFKDDYTGRWDRFTGHCLKKMSWERTDGKRN